MKCWLPMPPPIAFSGGARACTELLDRLGVDLTMAARRAHVLVPPCIARWWPDRTPSAQSTLGDGGGLIRVNVGMLVQLRVFVHIVASSLATITGEAMPWGADRLTGEQARTEFLEMLDEYAGGQRVPVWKTVRVHWGERERFRRQASMAGLAYVVAHELGHLVANNQEYLRAAAIRKGAPLPDKDFTEVQAVANFDMEGSADLEAVRILREWNPAEGESWEFARTVGAVSVMAIQSAKFWVEAATTDNQLDWKHPDPDLRIAGICLGLANPGELERLEQTEPALIKSVEPENSKRAERFVTWLDDVTGVVRFREAALKRDMTNRGLTAIQLAALYIARGVPQEVT